ncbi:LysR family transcriptional regulator [Kerstersia similis]|uniref:LysR family transcriptional regulator n=1 Tax=Kerstersia similis TaxID=206505 RepID=UPI0039F10E01
MAKLNLNAVRVFTVVLAEGSFAAAGKALGLPTSNVSRHINTLEQSLGTRLLERQKRPLQPTEAGAALFERFRGALDGLDDFVEMLRPDAAHLRGRLRVSLPSEVGPLLLGRALVDFVCQHPELEVRCVTTYASLDTGLADTDLAVLVGRGELPNSLWVARPLISFDSVVVAAPALIARHGRPRHTTELAHLPCITTASILGGAPWRFRSGNGRIVNQTVQAQVRLDSGALALEAARQGVGYAILARSACQAALEAGELEVLDLDKTAAPLELFAAYPQRKYLPRKIQALIAHFAQALRLAGPTAS